jgi:hypothetical protein
MATTDVLSFLGMCTLAAAVCSLACWIGAVF